MTARSHPRVPARRAFRIELYLPANSSGQRRIVRDAVRQLRERYGGATHSALSQEGVFEGEFDEGAPGDRDRVAYVFSNSIGRPDTREDVGEFLEGLLSTLHAAYRAVGAPQEAIMATVHPVEVFLASPTGAHDPFGA